MGQVFSDGGSEPPSADDVLHDETHQLADEVAARASVESETKPIASEDASENTPTTPTAEPPAVSETSEANDQGLTRDNSLAEALTAFSDRPVVPEQQAIHAGWTSANANETSFPVLSMADAGQLHASWSNAEQDDILGLSAPTGFRSSAYDSSNISIDRPLSVSRVGSSQSRVSSVDELNGVSSIIHDAARITNWQTVKELCEEQPESARYVGRDKWTALHHACNRRCPLPDVVEALIRAYPDALVMEEDKGWLPLHYACRFKAKPEVVRLLLRVDEENGRDSVSRLDKQGRTPLYYAVRYEAPPGVVGLLLDVDASAVLEEDQNADSPLALVWDAWAEKLDGKRTLIRIHTPSSDEEANSPTELAKGVLKRLSSQKKVLDKWKKVNMFLKAAFGFSVDSEDGNGCGRKKSSDGRKWRILHAAAAIKCHPSLFCLAAALHPEQALELDDDELKIPTHVFGGCKVAGKLTALHLAASSQLNGEAGKVVVSRLVEMNPRSAQVADSAGALPLHRVAENSAKGDWPLDGAEEIYTAYDEAAQKPDANGRLPLHYAAASIVQEEAADEARSARSVVCNLLEIHAPAACHADNFGCVPLHLAAKSASIWDVQLEGLHEANPAAVRTRTGVKLGNSLPIHMAASNPKARTSLIRRLVELHPRGASQSNRSGNLPLHLACETGLAWECIEAIHNAYPVAVRQPEGSSRGWTALHLASGCRRTGDKLISSLVELYSEAAGIADSRGRFPLHLACISGKTWDDGLSTLFWAYPDALRRPDTLGLLPFHIACFRYSAGRGGKINRPPGLCAPGSRRYSKSVAVETTQEARLDEDDTKGIEILYHLLKADPTVL